MNKPKSINEILNFEEHYARFMLPLLDSIEEKRKDSLFKFLFFDCLGITAFAIAIMTDKGTEPLSNFQNLLIVVCLILGFVFSFISLCILRNYKKDTKEKLFNILFSFIGNFKYQKESNKRAVDFRKIDFVPNFDKSTVDDYIKGFYKNLNIDIEEICLEKQHRGRKGRRYYTTVFTGLLITIPQLKPTNAKITIKNKQYTQAVSGHEEVLLEDVEFNKLYEVSATDQIEARYILTPTFMEKLKALHQKHICVAISLQDGEIIISMKKYKNLFEPPFWTTAKNINAYREILSQISEVLKIIDTLQLSIKPKL